MEDLRNRLEKRHSVDISILNASSSGDYADSLNRPDLMFHPNPYLSNVPSYLPAYSRPINAEYDSSKGIKNLNDYYTNLAMQWYSHINAYQQYNNPWFNPCHLNNYHVISPISNEISADRLPSTHEASNKKIKPKLQRQKRISASSPTGVKTKRPIKRGKALSLEIEGNTYKNRSLKGPRKAISEVKCSGYTKFFEKSASKNSDSPTRNYFKFHELTISPRALAELAKIDNIIGDYDCKLCGLKFDGVFALAQHRCSALNANNYKCEQCDKIFQTSVNLAAHARWHSKEAVVGTKELSESKSLPSESLISYITALDSLNRDRSQSKSLDEPNLKVVAKNDDRNSVIQYAGGSMGLGNRDDDEISILYEAAIAKELLNNSGAKKRKKYNPSRSLVNVKSLLNSFP